MLKNNSIPKVSIIVPAYNAERYIETCLDSLVRQTYKNIEIILVDDGSIDSTGGICDAYQQCYESFIKVEHCSHCGVSSARLLGIQKAVGEYVSFVDADDWIERDYISSMLSCMEEADIAAAGISREPADETWSVVCEYNGILAGKYATDSERQELYGKMLYCGAPYQFGVLPYICNKMFRKDKIQFLLEKIDKRIFDGEDVAVVYQYLLMSHRIVLTDACKYHYVNHRDSVSLSDSDNAYMNASLLYQELYVCFEKSEYCVALCRQLDYYMRRMIWKKDPAAYLQVNSFVFPYHKVEPGSRVILYGMGKAGNAFCQQIMQTQYCELIAWADRNCRQFTDTTGSIPHILPDEMKEYRFDYVVIAIENKIVAHHVLNGLISGGIEKKKVIIPYL